MRASASFLSFTIQSRLLTEHDDGQFKTLLFGFAPGGTVELPEGYTHLGVVVDGSVTIAHGSRTRALEAGDYFSVIGPAEVRSRGTGIVNSASGYTGANVFGGPIENVGRLRYIDGCSDSLLIPPIRKGDPCLNFLHFPAGITQTPHTHPSVRAGIVYRGRGECIVPDAEPIPLVPGCAFVIPTNAIHSFNTADVTMDVIAFHPDSDVGVTDDDHPMVNRTIVNGVSARYLTAIRTVTG